MPEDIDSKFQNILFFSLCANKNKFYFFPKQVIDARYKIQKVQKINIEK